MINVSIINYNQVFTNDIKKGNERILQSLFARFAPDEIMLNIQFNHNSRDNASYYKLIKKVKKKGANLSIWFYSKKSLDILCKDHPGLVDDYSCHISRILVDEQSFFDIRQAMLLRDQKMVASSNISIVFLDNKRMYEHGYNASQNLLMPIYIVDAPNCVWQNQESLHYIGYE